MNSEDNYYEANNIALSKLKAKILSEALPYLKKFNGKTIVVKLGGNVMVDENLKKSFAHDITWLKSVGINPLVIHGGGPQIEKNLSKLNKKAEFVSGHRVTDSETMDIVEMVLAGKVNKELVELINFCGGKSVGLTGQDGNLIKAKKLLINPSKSDNKTTDIGHVGDIEEINPEILYSLIRDGFIPVIAPIASGFGGETYNINADVVAGKLAEKIKAEKLILITNTPGVLDENDELITSLNPCEVSDLVRRKLISGGMLPKIGSAIDASLSGIESVHIIDGRIPNCLLLEVLTSQGVGTMIKAN